MKADKRLDNASSAERTAQAALDKTAQEAREIVDRLAGLANETVRTAIPAAAQFAHKTVDNLAAGAAPAAAWADEHAGGLDAAQVMLLKDARQFIRANPLTSIGIALAIGFLVGRSIR